MRTANRQIEISRPNAGRPLPTAARGIPSARSHREEGRALRAACPRSTHAQLGRLPANRHALAMLKASNEDRVASLIPLRHSRMLESPFAFFRGSAIVQANDLTSTPISGLRVQACGDCHLMNFGGFATPERELIFDINDFDETFPAPWEWDVKRLCVSLVLAARWRGFNKANVHECARAGARRYREMTNTYADMATIDVWSSHISYADIRQAVEGDRQLRRLLDADIKRAQRSTSEHVYGKITMEVAGETRITDQPPLLFHPQFDLLTASREFFDAYAQTLREDHRSLLQRYRLVDAALKVVGVGSVGTRCLVVLFVGEQHEPFFLQVKEARRSVLEHHAGQPPSPWRNHGERVVAGQHMMQAASDIFLGWSRGPNRRDFYVRQLRDMKVSFELEQLDARGLTLYGQLCGAALARAHAKAGQTARIAGYLGTSEAFDDAVCRYSLAYADQVERDYAAFQAAVRRGEVETETTGSIIETMIT